MNCEILCTFYLLDCIVRKRSVICCRKHLCLIIICVLFSLSHIGFGKSFQRLFSSCVYHITGKVQVRTRKVPRVSQTGQSAGSQSTYEVRNTAA